MARIEFFYDCSSPWTYLAFYRLQGLAAETAAEIDYRPVLVGGVFNAINRGVYEQRAHPVPAKLRYYAKDLADWARHCGIAIGMPPVFPVNSVKAMRGAFVALERGCVVDYSRAVFEAYWGDLQDISRDEVLARLWQRLGLDPAELAEKVRSEPYRQRLRESTDELIERGGFGSPTLFLNGGDMYFGNDRLELVRAALLARSA
jgi:2-hydroxychromene-2-carboxylate isomerase